MGKAKNGNKRYTKSEHLYIVENLFEVPLSIIAKRLGRTKQGVREYLFSQGISMQRKVMDHYRIYEIAQLLNVKLATIENARNTRKITPDLYANASCTQPLYSIYTIRNLVVNQDFYSKKKYQCMVCKKIVVGDLYCSKHLPLEMGLKPGDKKEYQINLKNDYQKQSGRLLAMLRKDRGLDQKDLARISSYDAGHISSLERGFRSFNFNNLNELFSALGYSVKIVIEKGPFVNG